MKVCFVTNIYPPTSTGGPGEVVHNLQKYMLEQGVAAFVFTCGKSDARYPYTIRTYGGKRLFPLISPIRYLKDVHKNHFDIMNFHLESGMGIAPLLYFIRRPKIITTLHSEHLNEAKATKRVILEGSIAATPTLEEWAVKYFLVPAKLVGTYLDISVSERIIAVSRKTKEDYLNQNQIPRDKISIIYNGVDSQRFNPKISGNQIRKTYGIRDSPLILTVGSGIILKGTVFVLYALSEIVKEFPKAKLMLIGIEPQYKKRMMPLIKRLRIQDNVILVGRVPNCEMPFYYSSSDIVMLPSISENFPVVALEAMSSGKPIVASRVGGIPEVITDNENGILVNPANVSQIIKALSRLLENRHLRDRMGGKGRSIVENRFDWKIIGKLYLKEFEKLI
jgi:glycosyltransferase involved in cell wall biosynthesis